MILTNMIRGQMAMKGFTIKKLAKAIGMSGKTLSYKMNHGRFYVDEAELLCEILEIDEPGPIFFAKVSRKP